MFERQRATALYFIDKLALRAGGEKDADEEADTGAQQVVWCGAGEKLWPQFRSCASLQLGVAVCGWST
jgi:DNA topoisomerase IB